MPLRMGEFVVLCTYKAVSYKIDVAARDWFLWKGVHFFSRKFSLLLGLGVVERK